jgi:hypothetical protein
MYTSIPTYKHGDGVSTAKERIHLPSYDTPAFPSRPIQNIIMEAGGLGWTKISEQGLPLHGPRHAKMLKHPIVILFIYFSMYIFFCASRLCLSESEKNHCDVLFKLRVHHVHSLVWELSWLKLG